MTLKRMLFWAAACLLLLPAALQAADVPGVTDTEVVIGWTTPLSGPAALWGTTGVGAQAWADYLNDQGGINGRKIKIVLMDDGYNPTRAMANLQEMKGKVFCIGGLLGTAVLNAAKDFCPDNKMPVITPYGDIRIWSRLPKEKLRYIFVAYPDYMDEADYLTTHAIRTLKAKKIALFYQNDDYGKMALQGVEETIKKYKDQASLAAAVPYEVTERALGTHALKIKESGADAVIIYATPSHGALIVKEMAKVAFLPKVLTTFTLGDPIMYKVAGEAWENTYIALPGNSGVPGSDTAADKVVEILLKYNPKLQGKEYLALFGAVSMMHIAQGIKNAGPDLNIDTFINGMEAIKDWMPEGVGAPVTYGPNRHHGNNASRIGQAQKGRIVPMAPFTIHPAHF